MILRSTLQHILEYLTSLEEDIDTINLGVAAFNAKPALEVQYLPHYVGTPLRYNHSEDSGFDLCACHQQEYMLSPGERVKVSLGIKIEIPAGYQVWIVPRSGMAAKYGLTLVNSPGIIDNGYTGEWSAILINLGHETFSLKPGMRICQGVLKTLEQAHFIEVEDIDEIDGRGTGGFGSTGE